jgi:hypothetical protein
MNNLKCEEITPRIKYAMQNSETSGVSLGGIKRKSGSYEVLLIQNFDFHVQGRGCYQKYCILQRYHMLL